MFADLLNIVGNSLYVDDTTAFIMSAGIILFLLTFVCDLIMFILHSFRR